MVGQKDHARVFKQTHQLNLPQKMADPSVCERHFGGITISYVLKGFRGIDVGVSITRIGVIGAGVTFGIEVGVVLGRPPILMDFESIHPQKPLVTRRIILKPLTCPHHGSGDEPILLMPIMRGCHAIAKKSPRVRPIMLARNGHHDILRLNAVIHFFLDEMAFIEVIGKSCANHMLCIND